MNTKRIKPHHESAESAVILGKTGWKLPSIKRYLTAVLGVTRNACRLVQLALPEYANKCHGLFVHKRERGIKILVVAVG